MGDAPDDMAAERMARPESLLRRCSPGIDDCESARHSPQEPGPPPSLGRERRVQGSPPHSASHEHAFRALGRVDLGDSFRSHHR